MARFPFAQEIFKAASSSLLSCPHPAPQHFLTFQHPEHCLALHSPLLFGLGLMNLWFLYYVFYKMM